MKKIDKSKDAFVLLIALAFISLLALGSTFLLRVSLQKAYTENNRVYTEMARIIAESGVHIAVSNIQRGFATNPDSVMPATFNPGIPATIAIQESNSSGSVQVSDTGSGEKYYVLTSTGTYGKQKATAAVLLRKTSASSDHEAEESLSSVGIYCGGNLTLKNKVEIDLRGSSMYVAGTIDNKGTVINRGADLSNPTNIAVDLDGFYKHAQLNGGPINGDVTVDEDTDFHGGILYVQGNVTITGKEKVQGCIIAAGNITVGNSASITSTGKFPALVSIGGNIVFKNGSSATGFVYAKGIKGEGQGLTGGSIDMKNGGQVTGAIFCTGNLELKAKEDFVYNKTYFPLGPDEKPVIKLNTTDGITVVRWLK